MCTTVVLQYCVVDVQDFKTTVVVHLLKIIIVGWWGNFAIHPLGGFWTKIIILAGGEFFLQKEVLIFFITGTKTGKIIVARNTVSLFILVHFKIQELLCTLGKLYY